MNTYPRLIVRENLSPRIQLTLAWCFFAQSSLCFAASGPEVFLFYRSSPPTPPRGRSSNTHDPRTNAFLPPRGRAKARHGPGRGFEFSLCITPPKLPLDKLIRNLSCAQPSQKNQKLDSFKKYPTSTP